LIIKLCIMNITNRRYLSAEGMSDPITKSIIFFAAIPQRFANYRKCLKVKTIRKHNRDKDEGTSIMTAILQGTQLDKFLDND